MPQDVVLSPEQILAEVRKFIPESVKKCQHTNTHRVTKGALTLLKNLPGARDAVLEYAGKVFFLAVNRQIRHMEVINLTPKKSLFSKDHTNKNYNFYYFRIIQVFQFLMNQQ